MLDQDRKCNRKLIAVTMSVRLNKTALNRVNIITLHKREDTV